MKIAVSTNSDTIYFHTGLFTTRTVALYKIKTHTLRIVDKRALPKVLGIIEGYLDLADEEGKQSLIFEWWKKSKK